MPTIDISGDFVVFDNTQTVTLLNPDGSGGTIDYALQQGVDTVLSDMGDGTLGYRTFCTWNLWRTPCHIANLIIVPQLNAKLTDKNGTNWYVSAVNVDAWGTKYQLECEAQAGTAVKEVDLP